jgi:hypothetical protein
MLKNNKKSIIFTKTRESVSDIYFPKPAKDFLPEWYKKTDSYIGKQKDIGPDSLITNGTIKKCVPVFDALTSGYIIPTYCDLLIKKDNNGNILYLTPNMLDAISFHPIGQAPYHPLMNNKPFPKWTNPWSIQTPSGYSSLFIPPVHSGNNFFTILEGFVDTDKYNAPVNFPFILNDIDFEGIIPAGTPMVQVIPIKRNEWKIDIKNKNNIKKSQDDFNSLRSVFFDSYKRNFWSKKEYR